MNQSEAFLFLTSCEFFLIGGGRENTNKKTQTLLAFSIFNQKNENKDKGELENRCISLIELSISYRTNFFHIK